MAASNHANTTDFLHKVQDQRKLLILALKLDRFLNSSKWKSMVESNTFSNYIGSRKRYKNTSKKKGNICKCIKCKHNVKKSIIVMKRDHRNCKTFETCRKSHNNSAALRNYEKHLNNDNESKNNEIDMTGDDVVNNERKQQNFYKDLNNDNLNTICQSEHQKDANEESSSVFKSGICDTKQHKRQMNDTRQRISKTKQHKKKLNNVKKHKKVTKVVKQEQNSVKRCSHKCKKGRKKTGLKRFVNCQITQKANKQPQQNKHANHVKTGGNDVTTDQIPPTTPGIFSKKGIRVKQQERFDKKKAFKHVNRRRVYRPSHSKAIRQKSEVVGNHNIEPRPKKRNRKFLNKSVEGIFKEPKKK